MNYKWPLSIPHFTWKDKFKFVKFILTDDRWTQGDIVSDFEKQMAKYVGTKYAVFTSSGSTANTLLAMYLKDEKYSSDKKIIIFPSTTWITSVSPFVREGFVPYFIDINLEDFSLDLDKTYAYLEKNYKNVAAVFPTSLIGFVPDIAKLKDIEKKFNVQVMLDNCENTLGKYEFKNVSSYFTSTTSTYFGHQIQSIEGGFIFTNDIDEYNYFLRARNHGMIRNLDKFSQKIYRNPDVDKRFDFSMLGNNFRNTNLNAFLGKLDLVRAENYLEVRRKLYFLFWSYMLKFLIFPEFNRKYNLDAPFCLPIIPKKEFKHKLPKIKQFCENNGIETRPIISGNLLRQTPFKYSNVRFASDFINSDYLHFNGIYVGLDRHITKKQILIFIEKLIEIFNE